MHISPKLLFDIRAFLRRIANSTPEQFRQMVPGAWEEAIRLQVAISAQESFQMTTHSALDKPINLNELQFVIDGWIQARQGNRMSPKEAAEWLVAMVSVK